MNKDLEILKYQSLKPVSENQDSLREIRKTSKNFAIVEAFLLGVIVGCNLFFGCIRRLQPNQ